MPPGGCNVVNWTDDTNGSHGCVGLQRHRHDGHAHQHADQSWGHDHDHVRRVSSPTTTGSHNVTLSTTSDPKTVTLSYSLTAKRAVTNKFLQLSSYAAGASNVTWSVGFTAPDRLIDSGNGIGSSSVTIKAPAGTMLPNGAVRYTFIDTDVAQDGGHGPERLPERHGDRHHGRHHRRIQHQCRATRSSS